MIAGLAVPVSARPEGAPQASSAVDRVVIGVRADLDSLNIYTASTILAQEISDLLFLHLGAEQADFDKGPPTFAPALARSWETSSDGLTLTFQLDPAARWSDGRPVTSADALFSHRAAVSPDVGWVGREVKDFIASVDAPDERTVRYRFTRRYPYQLMDASEGNVLPVHEYSRTPLAEWPKSSFTTAPVVSGPYRLAAYRQNEAIELERNAAYHGPRAGIGRVVFRIIPDEVTLLAELESGGIDVMENLPARQVARLATSKDLTLTRLHDLSYTYISWNTRSGLFSDPVVRRALTMAIDRQAIVDGLLFGLGKVTASPIISLFWAHDPSLAPLPYDPAGARELLARSGWKDSDGDGVLDRNGVPFRFNLESNQGSKLRNDVAVMVQDHLRRVGVDARPRVIEWGAFVAKHEKHDFDAFVGSQREATKVDLKSLLHSSAVQSGYNYGAYASREMDRIVDLAREEADTVKAKELWARAQKVFLDEQPLTILFERLRVNAASSRLKGVRMSPRSAFAGLASWRVAGSRASGQVGVWKPRAGR